MQTERIALYKLSALGAGLTLAYTDTGNIGGGPSFLRDASVAASDPSVAAALPVLCWSPVLLGGLAPAPPSVGYIGLLYGIARLSLGWSAISEVISASLLAPTPQGISLAIPISLVLFTLLTSSAGRSLQTIGMESV